jgi:hypothetical protein
MAGRKKFVTDHDNPFVRELESVRARMGYSQQQMARELDVPFRTYQKWIYAAQKPRHAVAILAQARGMAPRRRINCWDVLQCGREPGGDKVHLNGPCPAAVDRSVDGTNGGTNGGRLCWAISGTFCGAEVQGDEASKFISCFSCPFFGRVLQEEGLANFKLLRRGQTFTQT